MSRPTIDKTSIRLIDAQGRINSLRTIIAERDRRIEELTAALRELVGSLDAIEEAAGTRHHETVAARYDTALEIARAALAASAKEPTESSVKASQ